MSATDKDMYLLGTLSANNVVTLNVQLPSTSSWNGMVMVVDASGTPVADTDGNPTDGHFQGTIPANGAYYAEVLPMWSYNGHAYVVTPSSMTWANAEAYAQTLGGHLVTINDAAEQTWLQTTFGSTFGGNLWIGLTDQATAGTWVWSSGQAASYRNWASGQPNNSTNWNGAYFGSDGTWNAGYNGWTMYGLTESNASGTGGTGAGPWAQYILGVDVADLIPPQVTAVSPLPGNNNSTNGVLDKLTLTLSKDLDPTTVISSSFDLREAGPDGVFGTADDVIYSLGVDPYTSGLTVGIPILNGPLGNGHYRFTAQTTLLDRSGNLLGGGNAYVQFFTVGLPSGFVFEGRSNDTLATATTLSVSPQAAWDGSFTVLGSQNVGSSPYSVATGDFNGDGKPDLVTANAGSNSVSVLLGNGDGTFQSAVNYAVGSSPYSVAVGDFNGDSKPDLVTANAGSNNVSVLLGNGDGTFQSAVNYAVGSSPYSVAVGDFNGDSKPDLVTANYGSNNVSVLLGNGNGTFGSAVNYAVGTNPQSVALGDVNGDSERDLVTANYGSNNVSVLLGNGNGTFGSAVNYAVGTNPQSVALGDINGDGKREPGDGELREQQRQRAVGQWEWHVWQRGELCGGDEPAIGDGGGLQRRRPRGRGDGQLRFRHGKCAVGQQRRQLAERIHFLRFLPHIGRSGERLQRRRATGFGGSQCLLLLWRPYGDSAAEQQCQALGGRPGGERVVDGSGDREHPDDLGRGLLELHGVGGRHRVGVGGPLPEQQSVAVGESVQRGWEQLGRQLAGRPQRRGVPEPLHDPGQRDVFSGSGR